MFFRFVNKVFNALLLPFMQGTASLSSAWLFGCSNRRRAPTTPGGPSLSWPMRLTSRRVCSG